MDNLELSILEKNVKDSVRQMMVEREKSSDRVAFDYAVTTVSRLVQYTTQTLVAKVFYEEYTKRTKSSVASNQILNSEIRKFARDIRSKTFDQILSDYSAVAPVMNQQLIIPEGEYEIQDNKALPKSSSSLKHVPRSNEEIIEIKKTYIANRLNSEQVRMTMIKDILMYVSAIQKEFESDIHFKETFKTAAENTFSIIQDLSKPFYNEIR